MKFLVTGGAGFIGSHLANRLVNDGHSVRILDNFSTGSLNNLSEVDGKVEIFEGDIRNYDRVRDITEDRDIVMHLAAQVSVPLSIQDPIASHEVNVIGSINVLEAARQAKVQKVVLASSSAIYGNSQILPILERNEPSPLSPYAAGKLAGEYYARIYWETYGLPTVSLRYFNVYGPKQNPKGDYAAVIPKFINVLNEGNRPVVYGDGEQTRDFIYVDDAVEANVLAAFNRNMVGQEINVASGRKHSLNELLKSLLDLMNVEIEPEYSHPRSGDIKDSFANIEKLCSFGFSPKVEFRVGLDRTIKHLKRKGLECKPLSKVGGSKSLFEL
jgi:UDP-glucose 4-epimerase